MATGDIDSLRRRAEAGDLEAYVELGNCYEFGDGVAEDAELARDWYLAAAEKGHAPAQWELGQFYKHRPEPGLEQAAHWFRLAAEQRFAPAQLDLGLLLCDEEREGLTAADHAAGFEWIREAARRGEAGAQHVLSGYLRTGDYVAKDVHEANALVHRAAEQGYAPAQEELAMRLIGGSAALEADEAAAVAWAQRAAKQGKPRAQFLLGWCFAYGRGVERDLKQAEIWLSRALDCSARDRARVLGAKTHLRRVRFERRFLPPKAIGRAFRGVGFALLAFHLATESWSFSFKAYGLAVGLMVAVLGSVLVVPVVLEELRALRDKRRDASPEADGEAFDVAESAREAEGQGGAPGAAEPVSDADEHTAVYPPNKRQLVMMLKYVPAEAAAAGLPLFYLGLNPWTCAIAAVIFGLYHYPNHTLGSCAFKVALYYPALLFLLPTGILTLIAAHLTLDVLLLGIQWGNQEALRKAA